MDKINTVEYFTQLDNLMPLFHERLAAGQKIKFNPRGISMLPMLRQGIDSVTLSPLPDKLKKYDLPLYQRDDGIPIPAAAITSFILNMVFAMIR